MDTESAADMAARAPDDGARACRTRPRLRQAPALTGRGDVRSVRSCHLSLGEADGHIGLGVPRETAGPRKKMATGKVA